MTDKFEINNILIIGLGLVSGSILKLIKQEMRDSVTVDAYARRTETIEQTKDLIRAGYQDLNKVDFSQYDLVIIGLPIKATIDIIQEIGSKIRKDTLLIDISSVKEDIMKAAESCKDIFIGGHPLAGSEKKGFENSAADIMEGAKFILTPFKKEQKYEILKRFLEAISFKVIELSAEEHDRQVASISHLPYYTAVSLLNILDGNDLGLASTGLQSTTRVASSDPLWGYEVAAFNREKVVYMLEKLEKQLRELRYKIYTKKDILPELEKAKEIRENLFK